MDIIKIQENQLIDQLQLQQIAPLSWQQVEDLRENQVHIQPDVNIGMIGHVAHGKTSLTAAISGIRTTKSSEEKKRNITIQLGYANFKIYKCDNMFCPPPACYQTFGGKPPGNRKCRICDSPYSLARHMSVVDCPGHEMLMRTMLNGAAVMDSAVLVVASNDAIPQPQTAEHLVVAEIMDLGRNIITVQNKCDLIPKERALAAKHEIDAFLKGSSAARSPIVPVSCAPNFPCNVDVVIQYLAEKVPTPQRDLESPAHMKLIRSFDINKPGTDLDQLKGGVVGGSLVKGILSEGEIVEIRPGIVRTGKDGVTTVTPIYTRVESLCSESTRLKHALPGGLIAVGLLVDPILTKKDRLVGQVLGRLGTLPEIFTALEISFNRLKRVVGSITSAERVSRVSIGERLYLTIGSASIPAEVTAAADVSTKKGGAQTLRVTLSSPVCADINDKVSISRSVQKRWRLIGYGQISAGRPCLPASQQKSQKAK